MFLAKCEVMKSYSCSHRHSGINLSIKSFIIETGRKISITSRKNDETINININKRLREALTIIRGHKNGDMSFAMKETRVHEACRKRGAAFAW